METNIFEFTNYRKFLKAYYDAQKNKNKGFSHRSFAQKAGYSSSNFLYLIIEGKRNLNRDYITKFSQAMGLTKKEQQYFETMVSFNQAATPEAKRYYLEILSTMSKKRTGTPLKDDQYEFISNWYYPVIRELVTLPHFTEDLNWIANRLHRKITPAQAKDAIRALLDIGLLKRDESGRLAQADTHLITDDEIFNTAAYSFHNQMIDMAKEMLNTIDGANREISGVTMSVSKKQFKEIKQRVQDFRDAILKYLTDNPEMPETVFQMNVQLFPIINDGEYGRGK